MLRWFLEQDDTDKGMLALPSAAIFRWLAVASLVTDASKIYKLKTSSKFRNDMVNMQHLLFNKSKAMFPLYLTTFAPAQKVYRIGLMFTHKNGDFGAISVTERYCAAPIECGASHIE